MQRIAGVLCGAMLGLAVIAPSAHGQTRLVPSVSVSETYDTNVYFSSVGGRLQDYVTTITPSMRIDHKSRLLDGNAQISLPSSLYMKNPGLNYVSIATSVSGTLDQITGLVDQRWKLSVSDFITYTPQPPAFFTPQPAPASGPATTSAAPENFIRGIQAVRANSLVNIAGVNTSYILTPVTSLTAGIRHQYMRFGTAFAPTPGQGFFTTNFLSLNAGPQFRLTARDTVTTSFTYSHMAFSQPGGFNTSLNFEGGTAGWERQWTQKLSTNLTGGATVFSTNSSLQYLGSASVTWRERSTAFILSYSRSIFPSFYIAATPLLSQVVTASVTHQFTDRLSGNASANYAKNEAIGSTALQFDSYSGSASLNYAIAKTWFVAVSYSHMVIKNALNANNFNFDRDMASIIVSKQWPDFFQFQ